MSLQHSKWDCSYFSCLYRVTQFCITLEMLLCFSLPCIRICEKQNHNRRVCFTFIRQLPQQVISGVFLDYNQIIYTHNTVCLQCGLKAQIHTRNKQQILSGCHCKQTAESYRACMRAFRLRKKRAQSVSLQDFYAVHFFDVKMLVCQQLILQVSHRLERCHFKSDYPDITLVLRHVHLYKKIFNFC